MAPPSSNTPGAPALSTISGTVLIHGDSEVEGVKLSSAVSPAISVSTTFRNPEPENYKPFLDGDLRNPPAHVYSRWTQPVSSRAEHILSTVNEGYALTYACGLAASFAALISTSPKRVAIRGGYQGFYPTLDVYKKARGSDVPFVDLDDEYQPGDVCWLETPLNPTGESRDIKYYAEKIHAVGGKLIVDSTFAPPPLQYPFKWGADLVLHSGTKYFAGHSDALVGILVAKTHDEWKQLHLERTFLGSVSGSLESWLLLRSLKTFHLRVRQQSESATIIATWLAAVAETPAGQSFDGIPGGIILKVYHSSLQGTDDRGFNPRAQMEGGWNATFSIILAKPEYAVRLPHALEYFVPATSLGGVESLIEYRVQTSATEDPRLIRLSVGVEDVEDLKVDLRNGLLKVYSKWAKL